MPLMVIIPHKKLKSREATMEYLLDPDRLKSFIQDLRAHLKSTQHLFQKKGCEKDPKQCKHRGMYDRPDAVLFRRFHHFCDQKLLDWEAAREMLEIMLGERFLCECEMVWRVKDDQAVERLDGRRS